MPPTVDHQQRVEEFISLSRARGVPVTRQRQVVFETLLGCRDHPTADTVFARVSHETPDLSRATVYRALDTLVELGVVDRICHPGRAVRYDPQTEPHHHLVCLGCERIIDLYDTALDQLPVPDTAAHGFEVSALQVQLRGLCAACRAG